MLLEEKDRLYLDTYISKEPRFVTAYTSQLANLGCSSTGRAEQWHRNTHDVVHHQLTIEQSVQRLTRKIHEIYDLRRADTNAARRRVRMNLTKDS